MRAPAVVEEFQSLLRVQDLDGQVRDLEQEIASFAPRRVEAARAEAADAAAIESAREVSAECEREDRRLESELAVVDALVVKLDAQVYEVVSKQAMDAIQVEISAAQMKKSQLEDRVLELLDAIETATQELSDREVAARERASEHTREHEEMLRREPELRGEIESLEARRAKEVAGLEPEMLRGYEEARRRAWPVLVHAEAKSCPACRIVIAAQKWMEICGARGLVTCGSCHRILYGDKVARN